MKILSCENVWRDCKLYLIHYVEDIVAFLGLKVLSSDNSCLFSWTRNAQVTLLENTKLKINQNRIRHFYFYSKLRLQSLKRWIKLIATKIVFTTGLEKTNAIRILDLSFEKSIVLFGSVYIHTSKVIMQGKLFRGVRVFCTAVYCLRAVFKHKTDVTAVSQPDMGSIFHTKNPSNILVIGNYYVNYQNCQN